MHKAVHIYLWVYSKVLDLGTAVKIIMMVAALPSPPDAGVVFLDEDPRIIFQWKNSGRSFTVGMFVLLYFGVHVIFYGSNNRSLFTLPRASARNVHFLARALGTFIVSVFTLPRVSARYSVQAIGNFIR